MRAGALGLMVLILASFAGPARAQSADDLSVPPPVNGEADPGTSITLPDGGTRITFANGWVRRTEADNSFGPGGSKITEEDAQGRIFNIVKYDAKGTKRNQTLASYNLDGTTELQNVSYDADGLVMDMRRETILAPPAPTTGSETGSEAPGRTPTAQRAGEGGTGDQSR